MARLSFAFLLLSLLRAFETATASAVPEYEGGALLKRKGDVAVGDKFKGHAEIKAFSQNADETMADGSPLDSDVELRFAPHVYAYKGCLPYPAVDAEGFHGAGLRPKGKPGGLCRDFKVDFQVYARTGKSNERTGILFTYYLPKIMDDGANHRHHYISVVVWVRPQGGCDADNYIVVDISYQGMGGMWNYEQKGTKRNTLFTMDRNGEGSQTHPVIEYDKGGFIAPAQQGPEKALKAPQLIGWTKLTPPAQEQFNKMAYEHASCPFNDANFQATLNAAYDANYFNGMPPDEDCSKGAGPSGSTPPGDPEPDPVDPPTSVAPTAPTRFEPLPTGTEPPDPIENGRPPEPTETGTSTTTFNDDDPFKDDTGIPPEETKAPDGKIPDENPAGFNEED